MLSAGPDLHGLRQLRQLASALARTLDEEALLDDLTRGLQRAFGVGGVVLATVTAEGAVRPRRHFGAAGPRPLPPLLGATRTLAAAVADGRPRVVVLSPGTDDALREDLLGLETRSSVLMVVPMVLGHALQGVIVLHDEEAEAFDGVVPEFTSAIAMVAGAALRHAELFARSERERRQSDAMAEVARAVSESLRIAEVQKLILRHAATLLRATGACIVVRDGDFLVVEAAHGSTTVLAGSVLPLEGSLTGRVVRTGEALISNGVPQEPDAYRRNLALVPVEQAVIVPLRTGHGCVGALMVSDREEPFGESDARVLQRLADHVAVAVSNSRLFTELREATREWVSTFDAIGVAVLVVGDDERVVRANQRARVLAHDEGPLGLVGRSVRDVLGQPVDAGEDPLRVALDEGRRSATRTLSADGQLWEIQAAPREDGGAVVTFFEATS